MVSYQDVLRVLRTTAAFTLAECRCLGLTNESTSKLTIAGQGRGEHSRFSRRVVLCVGFSLWGLGRCHVKCEVDDVTNCSRTEQAFGLLDLPTILVGGR